MFKTYWKRKQLIRHRCSGMSIVEITVAMAILLVVMMGYSLAASSALQVSHQEDERSLAREGARAILEELGETEFIEVFARFNATPEDDDIVEGAGTFFGPHFEVRGLAPLPEDPDGRVGEILFPVDEAGRLSEDLEMPWLGMPRDLNADGQIDELDHTADYLLLPVLVRVEWMGRGGRSKLEFKTILKEL